MWNDWADKQLQDPPLSLSAFDNAFRYACNSISELLEYELFIEAYPGIAGETVLPVENIEVALPKMKASFQKKAMKSYLGVTNELELQPLLNLLRLCKSRAVTRREIYKEIRDQGLTDPESLHKKAINSPLEKLEVPPKTYSSCLVRKQRADLAQKLEAKVESLSKEVQILESSCQSYDQQITDSIARIKSRLLKENVSPPGEAPSET